MDQEIEQFATVSPTDADAALADLIDLMAWHSRGEHLRSLATWLARPDFRPEQNSFSLSDF